MLALYFAVRVQDDLVDDPTTDRTLAFLQSALFTRAQRLLAQLDPSQAAADFERLHHRFIEAALADLSWRRDPTTAWTPTRLARQGDKYLPMALPLVALARAAGRTDVDALVEAVVALSTGLQLTNDRLGAHTDLAEGLSSPWLSTLGAIPGLHTAADLPARLRAADRAGRLDTCFEPVAAAFADALAALAAWGCDGAVLQQHLQHRVDRLAAHHARELAAAAFAHTPLTVDIELTRRCNLRCPDCFVFAQEADMRHLAQLGNDLLVEILDELAGYRPHLHLTGGEPFSHPFVWELLDRAVAQGVEEVVVNTNGTFLSDARLARLSALPAPVRLLMSIDGPPGVHERVRGTANAKAVVSALRRARAHGVNALPASILSTELVEFGIARWQDHLTELLGEPLHLVLWPLFSDADDGVGRVLDVQAVRSCARQVAALMLGEGPGVTVADYPVINPWLRHYGVPASALWQCEAGRGRLCVQADATLTPCHPFRLPLGRLQKGRVGGFIQRVRHHADYKRIGRRDHTGCGTCPERSICGSCQARVVGLGQSLFTNDGRVAGCTIRTPLPVSGPSPVRP